MKIIPFVIFILLSLLSNGHDNSSFCKGIENGKFKKFERKFKRYIKSIPESADYSDTVSSEPTMHQNIESLTQWFKGLTCVEDAFQDKCEMKVLIYPGWSVIGVKFRTNSGIVEKCFSIQLGTTGTTNIFGWHLKTSRMKNKLVYRKMFECPGFISDQKRKCNSK